MKRRTLLSATILLLAIGIVALRDYLFVNLNYQLDFLEHERPFSYAHSQFRASVEGMNATDLRGMKWGLAAVFTTMNITLAVLLARVRTGDHRYRRFLMLSFAGITLLALMAHVGSSWSQPLRPVSIMLLHTVQYPIVLLFVWMASLRSDR